MHSPWQKHPGPRARHVLCGALAALLVTLPAFATGQPVEPPQITFEEAIARALKSNYGIAEAAQAILQAEALLQEARTVYRPTIAGTVQTTVLDGDRGFEGLVTQPQVQSLLGVAASYPVLAASRWAAKAQAEDRVQVAQLSAADVRKEVAIATAQAYLAVIAAQRQVEVQTLAIENAKAHEDYARARLEGGVGSKLNELRASQELATDQVLLEAALLAERRAQEALGVLTVADGPVNAAAEPAFEVPVVPSTEEWMKQRPDIQLFSAQVNAADRVSRDSWKDWVPTATASFEPVLLTPAGLFQPSRTWRGLLAFDIPIFDGGSRRAIARQREVALETARIQLSDVELRARAELRTAQASLEYTNRALDSARLAAQHADEVLRISDIAFRAGLTSNIELVDAQRRARDTDTAAAIAEDRVRQSRLDLLVALGLFPR
jgi:outer membrane protein